MFPSKVVTKEYKLIDGFSIQLAEVKSLMYNLQKTYS